MRNTGIISNLISRENERQKEVLRLIPSENYVSEDVRKAVGSVFMNKYSEGYPGKRYYQGNGLVDEIELLATERAKKLFGVPHANVQPYSGSIANAAVYFALLGNNDVLLGMELGSGGHLTHGYPKITFSGKYFESYSYSVNKEGFLDYEEIARSAREKSPQIIISGASAYPRKIDFSKIGQIADEVGAYHMADISHIAGLVATGVHESPVGYAHIITTTTHKTLRGPRGAMILVTEKGLQKDMNLAQKIDKAVFPGMQGGPHDNTTAAIAQALGEALNSEFNDYAKQVVRNAAVLAQELKNRGFTLITGGTDNHLILMDMRPTKIDAWLYAWALEYSGVMVNRNAIPHDPNPPFYPSGIRLGTPAITTLGFKEKDMPQIADWFGIVANETKGAMQECPDSRAVMKAKLEERAVICSTKKEVKQYLAKFKN